VKIPKSGIMFIGYDSYHDSSKPVKDGKKCSVGAFVSSLNDQCTRFCSSVTFHYHNEEMMSEIGACLTKALRAYE